MNFDGTVAIVTGAGSGIGRATTIAFAAAGASVVAVGRRQAPLDETVTLAKHGSAVACVGDMTRESDVANVVAFAAQRFDKIDVGVHAAGGTFDMAPTHEQGEASFRDWLDSHLVSSFLFAKHVGGALMKTGRGSLTFVGTFVGHTKALPGTVGYASAKAGLFGLVRTAAADFAPHNVRANLIVSGGADTPMARTWSDTPDKWKWAEDLHLMQRIADPAEIASTALFLASDAASFMTASVLTVDGGVSIR